MDTTVLKTLLDSQNQAYRGALEVFKKEIGDNVNSLQSTISELKRSLEFTQKDVDELKQEVKLYQQELEARPKHNQDSERRLASK